MAETPFLMLFVPADRPERFAKAALAGPDAIVVDLEDAVGEANKDAARASLVEGLGGAALGVPVVVRVNARATPHHAADVEAIGALGVAGVMLPKAESRDDLEGLRRRLPSETGLFALVESARGLANAREIAAASDRLVFGSIDYSLSIGAHERRDTLLSARSELVLAAALAGRPGPIDGVTTSVGDGAAIRDDARYAHALGFAGKLLIHPRQVGPALAGFAPGEDEVVEARRVLQASGGEAAQIDGRMIDTPVVEGARRLIDYADRIAARLAKLEAAR